jgi:pimeloyl-ACP methyl ester carboxylesterase
VSEEAGVSRARRGAAARVVASVAGALASLLVAVAVGVVAPAPASARAQQAPVPVRPVLLIGGTFVGQEHADWTDDPNVPGDPDIVGWLGERGGYQLNATNQRGVWVGQLCRDTGDQPYDFARCGTTTPAQPTNWQDVVIINDPHNPDDDMPCNWDCFRFILAGIGSSTAGLSQMEKSVQYVMDQINLVRLTTGSSQIDIVAHSQGGTIARAAVRRLKEANPSAPGAVRRLVMLGTPQYGSSPDAPLFDILDLLVGNGFMATCRDERRLPMCPDMFLTGSSATVGAQSEIPVTNPLGYTGTNGATIPFTHRPGFTFFNSLNASTGVGATPSDTQFYNLYTRDYEGDGVGEGERLIVEQINLFPGRPNVTNTNFQDVCALAGVTNFGLHHNAELVDPTSRAVVALALGFPYTEPAACT